MMTMRIQPITSCLILFFLVFQATANAQTHFADTRAAQAFKAENYELALEGFTNLAQVNPDNPLVLRYLAITQRMLGQYSQSIQPHLRTLEISPDKSLDSAPCTDADCRPWVIGDR